MLCSLKASCSQYWSLRTLSFEFNLELTTRGPFTRLEVIHLLLGHLSNVFYTHSAVLYAQRGLKNVCLIYEPACDNSYHRAY